MQVQMQTFVFAFDHHTFALSCSFTTFRAFSFKNCLVLVEGLEEDPEEVRSATAEQWTDWQEFDESFKLDGSPYSQ